MGDAEKTVPMADSEAQREEPVAHEDKAADGHEDEQAERGVTEAHVVSESNDEDIIPDGNKEAVDYDNDENDTDDAKEAAAEEDARQASYRVFVIETLAAIMEKKGVTQKMEKILSARVPLLKLTLHSGMDCDINVNNELGGHNSALLAAYVAVDERFRKLGLLVKRWAKLCKLNDASAGSFSSYSLMLLLIHFLQRRTPAVLPYLQQMGKKECTETMICDGWDCYYCDENQLDKYGWLKQNTESVGELFIGFFSYYVEQFDFENDVVGVRSDVTIKKEEKEWAHKPLAVEDPFELVHNTVKGISKKGAHFVLGAFLRARNHFASNFELNLPAEELLGKLFDETKLTGGKYLENENGCYVCGKIGHFAMDCPRKKQNQVCFICNKPGHIARKCPEQKSRRTHRPPQTGSWRNGRGGGRGGGGGGRGGGGLWSPRYQGPPQPRYQGPPQPRYQGPPQPRYQGPPQPHSEISRQGTGNRADSLMGPSPHQTLSNQGNSRGRGGRTFYQARGDRGGRQGGDRGRSERSRGAQQHPSA